MIVRCTICGRTHGQKESELEGVSSSICAKCYAVFYKDNMDDLKEIFKNDYVLPEVKKEIVWQGPEKEYKLGELDFYNNILADQKIKPLNSL